MMKTFFKNELIVRLKLLGWKPVFFSEFFIKLTKKNRTVKIVFTSFSELVDIDLEGNEITLESFKNYSDLASAINNNKTKFELFYDAQN